MVRSVPLPQLSSAKPRTGLQSVGALAERLIRMYELQASVRQRIESPQTDVSSPEQPTERPRQATFEWYC